MIRTTFFALIGLLLSANATATGISPSDSAWQSACPVTPVLGQSETKKPEEEEEEEPDCD